ncbi:MAG: sulfatase-like hydrolase/transferase [Paludibacteraceae bacterium]|nr:sulfatase-like hydrolase/transferase [Paludibacteraceae bacterium]
MKKYVTLLEPLGSVLLNLLLVYIVYFISRLTFVWENWAMYPNLEIHHLWELIRGGLLFDTSAILYTNVLWVLMVLFPLHWKETDVWHRICRWVFVVVNVLALFLNMCDSVYFRFSMRRTTTTIFKEFSNEGNLGDIFGTEIFSHWYLFLLLLAVAYMLWKFYFISRLSREKIEWRSYTLFMVLSLLAFTPFCIAGMRGGWTRDIRPITISNANNYCDRPTEAAIVLNTPFSLIRTIGKNKFDVPSYFPEKTLSSFFDPVYVPKPSHPFREKNVVVLIVESFGREYIGAYNKHIEGYPGYTPFLDSLIENGALTYRYSYCNGRKSIDGMPSILSSIPMFVEPFFLSPYSINHVSGLADCLNEKGYETAFFHGAERGSMGFMAFARATKFKDYYGREDFVADRRTQGDSAYDGWWGISDEPFLQYYCMKMSEMKQPFMTALFTLSSHHPFRVPKGYESVYKEENPDMPILKVIRYTDMALQHFFDSARKQPWFSNTIFAITSDHTNMSAIDEYRTDLGGFCSPVIFYDPSGELGSGMVDAIAQQTDIMPTILDYLGYDKPFVSFGVDLLNTPKDSTWAVNYLNGVYQYVKYGYVLQFDGQKTTAVFSLQDRKMVDNLKGKVPQQEEMEQELKAIIQQYMERMIGNRLVP